MLAIRELLIESTLGAVCGCMCTYTYMYFDNYSVSGELYERLELANIELVQNHQRSYTLTYWNGLIDNGRFTGTSTIH